MQRSALLSDCRQYRYTLERVWDDRGNRVLWVMLNPSTADENIDDATIRRCIGFSQSWGLGGLVVANLFAVRSTDPRGVLLADDPVGPENDEVLRKAASECISIVCAWGGSLAQHHLFQARERAVCNILAGLDSGWPGKRVLCCLGTNADGTPKHPVRLASDTPLQPFAPHF